MGNILGLFMLAATCIGDCFIWVFIVPKFAQIFRDALPGKPLPGVTLLFIRHHFLFVLLALAWPIVGVILHRTQNRYASRWIIGGIGLFILLTALTIFAMFTPMVAINEGMSDAGR